MGVFVVNFLFFNVILLECWFVEVNSVISDLFVLLCVFIDLDVIFVCFLFWFVWYFGIDIWKDYWFEQIKCVCVKVVIFIVCKKGIVVVVCVVVVFFGVNIVVCEWWQMDLFGLLGIFDLVMIVSVCDGNLFIVDFIGDIVVEIDCIKFVCVYYIFI